MTRLCRNCETEINNLLALSPNLAKPGGRHRGRDRARRGEARFILLDILSDGPDYLRFFRESR